MAWTERYVRADADGTGDGTTDANSGATGSWTIAQALTVTTGAQPGHRVNVKAGAYSMGTATTVTTTSGTATSPIWWRGYNTTIGDLDTDHSTARPVFTWTTGRFDVSHQYQLFSSMDFIGAPSQAVFRMLSSSLTLRRCNVENTSTSSGAYASLTNANSCNLIDCYFKTASATATWCVQTQNSWIVSRCRFEGGISAVATGSNNSRFNSCVFTNSTNGVLTGNGVVSFNDCIFFNCGDYGIKNSAASSGLVITSCIFSEIGTGIAYTGAGTRPFGAYRSNNAFNAMTTAQESGFGDMPAFNPVTLTADPFVDAAAGDFNINNTAGGGAALRAVTVTLP